MLFRIKVETFNPIDETDSYLIFWQSAKYATVAIMIHLVSLAEKLESLD